MKQYLCTDAPNDRSMPPVDEWRLVEASAPDLAAAQYTVARGYGPTNVLVTLACNYENGEWNPTTLVHSFLVSCVQTGQFTP